MKLSLVKMGLAIAWTLMILVLWSIPGPNLPPGPSGLDKLVHITLFMGLTVLWRWAIPTWKRQRLWVSGLGILYGCLLEVYQGWFIPGRMGDVQDAIANSIGVLLGLLWQV